MRHKLLKRLTALASALVLTLTLLPAASAAGTPASSRNINKEDYLQAASPVTSYLCENGQGVTRVEYTGGKIVVEDYDASYNLTDSRTIPMELSTWGGFYAGRNANFFIFGQNNMQESPNAEVIRVVKYSKNWQRQGEASLTGANTQVPFAAGSVRCAEYGGYLYIHTCHTMFKYKDGLNHQSNLVFCVNENSMTVSDAFYDIWNEEYGYVSHSFNQHILIDNDGMIVTINHGDGGNTRGVVFMRYYADAGTGKFTGAQYGKWCAWMNMHSFPGASGNNTTGGSIGGLMQTSSRYIYAYNDAGKADNTSNRAVYLLAMDIPTGVGKKYQISNGKDNSTTPVLAPLGSGGYLIWNIKNGSTVTDDLMAVKFGSDGAPAAMQSFKAPLSDCQPIEHNGKAVWYVTNNSAPTFYGLDDSGVTVLGGVGAETPTTPDKPSTPTTPDKPDTPTTPDKPSTPTTPDKPDTPTTPDKPSTPTTPDKPDTPTTPDKPSTPTTPDKPSTPTTPDKPTTPTTPDKPSTSKASIMTGSVDLPQLSKQEIIDLLEKNSLTLPSKVFDVQPSCTAPYEAGKLSNEMLQATLNRLNAWRRIVGLPNTSLDSGWNESAQYGAVVIAALGELTHTPSQPAGMDKTFYQKGYSAANSSNLYIGLDLLNSVDGWMDDSNARNIDRIGHRRWQLSPALNKVGFGLASGSSYPFTVEKVFESGYSESKKSTMDYDSFGWPCAGYFPNDLRGFNANTAWSVSLNPDLYAVPSGVTVRISGGGKTWTLSGGYQAADSGKYLNVAAADGSNYGSNHCIIFRPDGVTKYEGTYTVEITGLKYKKDNSAAPFTYTVDFFAASKTSNPSTPSTPSTPSKPSTGSIGSTGTTTRPSTGTTTKPSTTTKPGTTTTKPTTTTTTKPTTTTTTTTKSNPFTDVSNGSYYYDAVLWALENNVTTGVTANEFRPSSTCTRGQVVTFLWRAKGCPEPKTTSNPFRDVSSSSAFYKAILWAYENGITTGATANTFNPDGTCTSGHVVTFLWRANGKPSASGRSALATANPGKYYTDAVAWADAGGLLANTGAAFNPAAMSPRADIVTYLYRNAA